MKYLSIDIETTGINSETDEILSIGIIVEDTSEKLSKEEIPTLHIRILHERISGSIFAINMNSEIIDHINERNLLSEEANASLNTDVDIFCKKSEVVRHIFRFLYRNKMLDQANGAMYPDMQRVGKSSLNVAGKNFGTFDKLFIEKLPYWQDVFRIRQRILDPAILFTDWQKDEVVPNLSICKDRAGFDSEVTHDAVDDAWDVITLLRTQY